MKYLQTFESVQEPNYIIIYEKYKDDKYLFLLEKIESTYIINKVYDFKFNDFRKPNIIKHELTYDWFKTNKNIIKETNTETEANEFMNTYIEAEKYNL